VGPERGEAVRLLVLQTASCLWHFPRVLRYKDLVEVRSKHSITASLSYLHLPSTQQYLPPTHFIMRSAIVALATTVTAVAADVSVVWRHEISSGSTSLSVHSADGTVLAETCGSLLASLDFRKLNGYGAGQCT
jgi:hypothetical protein